MVIENLEGCRRRQVLALWAILFLAHQSQLADAIGLSRNPLFSGFVNRRNAIPAATINSLHHHQQQFQHHHKRFHQQQEAAAASAATNARIVVDPYVSGSNSVDNKPNQENADQVQASSDPLTAQTSHTLAVASSSYSAAGGSGGAYGSSSGGSGGSGGSYGSGSGGASGGYGGGAGGSGGSYGGGSSGSGGGYGDSASGYGSSASGGGYGGGSDGSSYGSGGSGGGSYGSGGAGGGSYGGISGGSYGSGGAGAYGGGAPSYSVAIPAQGNTKADTIHLLSSLAPSLLLSSLLLPLALALLTNATGSLTGRKKRDLFNLPDDDEDTQFFLEDDTLDADITSLDAHFFPTVNAMLESYSPGDTERLIKFVNQRGLSDPLNPCLEKLACLAATTKSKFKRSDTLKKAMTLMEKTVDPDIKKRLKEGSSVGTLKDRNCLTKFICKSMSSPSVS